MSLGAYFDFLLSDSYNIDSRTMHKIYESMRLLEKYYGDDALDIVLKCITTEITKEYISSEYHRNHQLYLIADEFYTRIKKVNEVDRLRQINLFLDGKLTLRDISKKRTNVTIIPIYKCIGCDNDTVYDTNSRKYNCETCYVEYAELG